MGWDGALLRAVADHRVPWLTDLAYLVMVVGQNRVTYGVAAVVGVLIAWRMQAWWHLLAGAVAFVVAIGLAGVAKDVIGRPRPAGNLSLVDAAGWAMPSDVAAMTAAAALPLVVAGLRSATREGRAVAAVAIAVTVVGGLSTIYLGAHWPSDVLAGWALGVLTGWVALVVVLAVRSLLRRVVHRSDPVGTNPGPGRTARDESP